MPGGERKAAVPSQGALLQRALPWWTGLGYKQTPICEEHSILESLAGGTAVPNSPPPGTHCGAHCEGVVWDSGALLWGTALEWTQPRVSLCRGPGWESKRGRKCQEETSEKKVDHGRLGVRRHFLFSPCLLRQTPHSLAAFPTGTSPGPGLQTVGLAHSGTPSPCFSEMLHPRTVSAKAEPLSGGPPPAAV